MNYKHNVFISYSSKDKRIADAICHSLEEHNITCWIAPRDVSPGVTYAREIIDGIRKCEIMVLVYSKNANTSQHVGNEIDQAFHEEMTIIPFLVDDTPMNEELNYYLARRHWLVAYPNYAEKYESLAVAVSNVLGKNFIEHISQPKSHIPLSKNDETEQATSSKTEKVENSQAMNSSQNKQKESHNWWENYGMTPVSVFKFIPVSKGKKTLTWLCFIAGVSSWGLFFVFLFYKPDEFLHNLDSFLVLFAAFGLPGLIFSVLFYCGCYGVFPNYFRKQRKQLLDLDFIEQHKSRKVRYVIVARGTAQSHFFGLYDIQSVKLKLPFEYTELQWLDDRKLLSAIKDGQKFVVDVNGNIYQ